MEAESIARFILNRIVGDVYSGISKLIMVDTREDLELEIDHCRAI